MSLVTTMFLTSGAYAAQITGADFDNPDVPDPEWVEGFQFGFGGLNLDNITVNMITADGNEPIVGIFDEEFGEYPDMNTSDSYQSAVFSRTDTNTQLGYVTGKIWPISEPTGIKVINNDKATNKYKPNNCIMASSYLGDSNTSDTDDRTYFLDNDIEGPKPVICSSYAGSSKRFQLVLNESMMTPPLDPDGYGKHIDLVFNIDPNSEDADHRYQVFQKVTNRTGMRLDGLKVQVLNANEQVVSDLNISLGLGEGNPADGGDIWKNYEMAFYPPGLWGDGSKEHLPIGWFDVNASGYEVDGNGTDTITTGAQLVDGNYVDLFGNWLPYRWVAWGMHKEISVTAEPVLLAYWGTTPTEPNVAPAWHYGEYDYLENHTGFSSPTVEELAAWAVDLQTPDNPDGEYVIDAIEDLPNISLNYIINVGAGIDNNFTIRFTPKVSATQDPPSYFNDVDTRIAPAYLSKKGIVKIVPEPTFTPGSELTIIVADADLNDPLVIGETKEVNVTNNYNGDLETVMLTEIAAYGGVFTGSLPTVISDSNVTDGNMSVTVGTVVTVTYNDEDNGTAPDTVTASTTAYTPPVVDPVDPGTGGGGGGGCSYNPNSKNFDMTFLMLMALGLLYPFRRRFLK